MIIGFKTTGTKNRMVQPINVGIISDNDDTDIVIPEGTKMVIRDVIAGSWPGNRNRALWLRVVYEPK